MKKILLVVIIAGYIQASEMAMIHTPSSSYISVLANEVTAAKSMSGISLSTFVKVFQAIGLAFQIKSSIDSPINATVAYGLQKGVSVTYPNLKDWITWQMSGQITKLSQRKSQLQSKIDKSLLPMRIERNELATIDHILSQKVTEALAVIADGNQAQADIAMNMLYGERWLYQERKRIDPTVVPDVNSLELLRAKQIYTEQFSVEPVVDMVMTPRSIGYDIVSDTAQEVFANLDISKFRSDESFVSEIESRIEHLKNIGLFTSKEENISTTNAMKVLNAVVQVTERFGQRMKVNTALKIFLKINDALDPFIRFTPLKQNLENAVYNKRPHLGHKLEVLYADNIGAFYALATDIALYIKTETGCSLKKGAAAIDTLGNFINELDKATDKIYQNRFTKEINVNH